MIEGELLRNGKEVLSRTQYEQLKRDIRNKQTNKIRLLGEKVYESYIDNDDAFLRDKADGFYDYAMEFFIENLEE